MTPKHTIDTANGVSNDAVVNKTGKGWAEWFAILDEAGAASLSHREIARWLGEHHPDMGGWWHQMVTVAYEKARGLRDEHQKADGYAASISRTLAAPLEAVYAAFAVDATRRSWLGAEHTVRRANENKSMRITWGDGASTVSVYFYEKGPAKCQVAIQHEKLPDRDAVDAAKAMWREALGRLGALVTGEQAG